MDWRISSDAPIYSQLTRLVRQEIVSGGFAPGEKLPPVRELAAAAGVNPNTMQRAMAELEREGLVFTQRTAGRFVTGDSGRISAARRELAREETERYCAAMAALGCTPGEVLGCVSEEIKEERHGDT